MNIDTVCCSLKQRPCVYCLGWNSLLPRRTNVATAQAADTHSMSGGGNNSSANTGGREEMLCSSVYMQVHASMPACVCVYTSSSVKPRGDKSMNGPSSYRQGYTLVATSTNLNTNYLHPNIQYVTQLKYFQREPIYKQKQ